MNNLLNKCAELLAKLFTQSWIAPVVAAGGLVGIFIISLFFAMVKGDFIRCRRACKLIANKKSEEGMKMLKNLAPDFNSERYFVPPPTSFNYEKIIMAPYLYSGMKSLKDVTIISTGVFCFLSGLFSVLTEGALTFLAAVNIIIVAVIGLLLIIFAMLVSRAYLKSATDRFASMLKSLRDVTFSGEQSDDDRLLPSTIELLDRIQTAVQKNESSYEALKDLYLALKKESRKPQSAYNSEKLKEAADLLNMLLEAQ